MRNVAKATIVVALAAAVAGTVALREARRAPRGGTAAPSAAVVAPAPGPPAPAPRPAAAAARPRLLELGSTRCMTCQQMAVVLDALRASRGDRLQVDFIDVMEHPEQSDPYKITLIPTQILYDASGRELYRHIGFFSEEEILAKFRTLGVEL